MSLDPETLMFSINVSQSDICVSTYALHGLDVESSSHVLDISSARWQPEPIPVHGAC